MIRWGAHLLGRPFAIVDWRNHVLEVWIRRLGAGTEELFQDLKQGAQVDLTLPLGHGFDSDWATSQSSVLLISGGVGAASLLPVAHAQQQLGKSFFWLHGERDPASLDVEWSQSPLGPQQIWIEEGAISGKSQSGRVTQGILNLESLLGVEQCKNFSSIVVCGPTPMLEAVSKTVLQIPLLKTIPVYLGLEEKMGCGIGLCFSCSVWTESGMKRLCTEGPWFQASEIAEHFVQRNPSRWALVSESFVGSVGYFWLGIRSF
jgi:dihydroorotate dehydrogenase electron transfer subunit